VKTLAEYTDWMKGLMIIMPHGSYEVKSFATDTERNNVTAYAVFSGTHTGPGGPCEPTGKKTISDYVYVMQFTGDKISQMTKIWHSGLAIKELGWAQAADRRACLDCDACSVLLARRRELPVAEEQGCTL
jgi:hypothetical protein